MWLTREFAGRCTHTHTHSKNKDHKRKNRVENTLNDPRSLRAQNFIDKQFMASWFSSVLNWTCAERIVFGLVEIKKKKKTQKILELALVFNINCRKAFHFFYFTFIVEILVLFSFVFLRISSAWNVPSFQCVSFSHQVIALVVSEIRHQTIFVRAFGT